MHTNFAVMSLVFTLAALVLVIYWVKKTLILIARSEKRYKRLFDNISDAVIVCEAVNNGNDFIIRDLNLSSERIEKIKRKDVIGKSILDVFPNIKEFGLLDVLNKVWQSGQALKHPAAFYKNDRISGWRENYVYKLPGGEIVLIYKDITELKQVDKLKDEFVSTVSHELRTPLSIIKEGLSLVLDEITGKINEKQKDVLTTAKNNIDRLAQIINDLLDISKLEAGKVELQRGKINIAGIIEQIAQSFRPRFEEKGLELKLNVSSKEIFAYADKDKMIKVFTNLVSNALKFTEKGWVEISVREKDKKLMCIVEDTGIGISRENLPKVFTKFQQFGRTPGPGIKGTGLGLSIVKGIIELHGGKIWLESVQGKGSRFIFTLPVYTAETLLKDFIKQAVDETGRRDTKLSVILISLLGVNKLGPGDEIQLLYDDIETLIKNSLYEDANKVIRDKDYAVVLFDCSKEDTYRVESRLERAIEGYLNSKGLSDTIRLKFGSSVYPDDADNAEQLIQKCEVNVEGSPD